MKRKKIVKPRSPAAQMLQSRLFQNKIVKPKRGKGSYNRKVKHDEDRNRDRVYILSNRWDVISDAA